MKMIKRGALIRIPLLVLVVLGLSQGTFAIQASAAAQSATTNIPSSISVLARLSTDLDAAQAKVGDPVEAQILEDVKSGHDVLLKKGSILNGHITFIQPFLPTSRCEIAILFDRVTPKKGEPVAVSLTIQALAPEINIRTDTLSDGRGMGGLDANAPNIGHQSAKTGDVGALSDKSRGVYAIPGVTIGTRIEKGGHSSVVVSASGGVHLKKGAQLVMQGVG
jgi:hypothetical protein